MPWVPEAELKEFTRCIENATQRIGGGKVATDTVVLRQAVRDHKEAAYRYTELHCAMAASQPGYLQPALMVAMAYKTEFSDESLVTMVMERAQELNAMEHLRRMGVYSQTEQPERQARRHWWNPFQK